MACSDLRAAAEAADTKLRESIQARTTANQTAATAADYAVTKQAEADAAAAAATERQAEAAAAQEQVVADAAVSDDAWSAWIACEVGAV